MLNSFLSNCMLFSPVKMQYCSTTARLKILSCRLDHSVRIAVQLLLCSFCFCFVFFSFWFSSVRFNLWAKSWMCPFIQTSNIFFFPFVLLIISLLVSTFHYVKNISFCEFIHFPYCIVRIENKKVQIPPRLKTFFSKSKCPQSSKTLQD